jgi:Zn ribbon nucleic-acid-binding protein
MEYKELKRCPFCGGEASFSIGRKDGVDFKYVECIDCASTAESKEDWNKRCDLTIV